MIKFEIRTLFFNALQVFRNKYRLAYCLATILNAAIAIFMASFSILIIRQSIVTALIFFLCVFDKELVSAKQDLGEVQKTLVAHNSLFLYDTQFLVLSPIAAFVAIINLNQQVPKIFLYLSMFYLLFMCFYTVYRWHCIYTIPEARVFLTRPIRSPGTGKRHIAHYIAAGFKYLPEVGRGFGLVGSGLSLIAAHSGFHKIAYGYESRPPLFNAISYVTVGLTCPCESGYNAGISLIKAVEKLDPDLRSKITDPNSFGQINEEKVLDYIDEHDLKKDEIGRVIRKDLKLLRIIAKARGLLDTKED